VHSRFADPDYQLVWPRSLFVAEAAKLLSKRHLLDWDERCKVLLVHAFVSGYQGGPQSEFEGTTVTGPWGTLGVLFSARQQFLKDLMDNADQLAEDSSHRRPYYRERKAGDQVVRALDDNAVVREFLTLFIELDDTGYFDKRFGVHCEDDPRDHDVIELFFRRELGVDNLWPLKLDHLLADMDLFFDVVELLHDHVARPSMRSMHGSWGCGWHYEDFEIGSGRTAYRWRVNQILERSHLGLRLADEGDDIGRLVTATDEARSELLHAVITHDGAPADQVRHALSLFRERGADRNQKRSAVAALALVLEERRHNVLIDALAKSDRGALFDIANNFHIRHQDSKQKRDYEDFYLDWVFWLYLASIELTNRIIDEQAVQPLGKHRKSS
jgi:hypothetical protein